MHPIRTCVALAAFLTLLCLPVAAQQPDATDPVSAAHDAWNQDHGAEWLLTRHDDLATARYLWGRQAEAAFTPETDADWFELARIAFDRAYGMFQVADATLVPVSVRHLDLWAIGTTDKVAVEFSQSVRGVPVVDASVHALFTPQGDLLALDSRAMPGAERVAVRPAVKSWAAAAVARDHFVELEQMPAATVGQPELVILKHRAGRYLEARLAWSVEVRNETVLADPAAQRIFVAADRPGGGVLQARTLIHYAAPQIQGSVESYATPGTRAHSASNPPTLHDMPFMTLTSSAGNVTTDANGDFTFASGSPVTFTAGYSGPYCTVINNSGANHTASMTFQPGTPATLTMNTAQTEYPTSEASCYDSVLDMRRWIKQADPNETMLDFQVLANANLTLTCNAFFNGSSINMFRAGGGCNNTGFSTVVVHEEGHWANVLSGSGNGPDGFGEGNADVYAMYVYDTPIVGDDFFTSGGFIRTGLNTRQFCGDANTGCYGQVHADGEVLMGAMWKVRDRLNQSLGNAAGDMTANVLHTAWMSAFNDGQIKTVIEEHWLTLDDDDGNVLNGTPNFAAIDGGFQDQGFPGFDLQVIGVQHANIGDSQSESGPYVVDAQIASLVGNAITGADVYWAVDGGGSGSAPMTNVGGNAWSGGIPGQPSPAHVAYWIEARDSAGNDERFPRDGEFRFVVGIKNVLYGTGFEGPGNEGWTHAASQGLDEWERGAPQGLAGDPGAAFAGNNAWGVDLSGDGEYEPDTWQTLSSPSIDTTGVYGIYLKFARHLHTEEGRYDQAEVMIGDDVVWSNDRQEATADQTWMVADLDVDQWAFNSNNVVIRFRQRSNGSNEAGGWNVDEVELYTLDPVNDVDRIALTGPALTPAGVMVAYNFDTMAPLQPWWFLGSTSNAGQTFQGHAFDVGQPVQVLGTGTASGAGAGSFSFVVPGSLSGTTVYLEVANLEGPGDWRDSNVVALQVL